MRLPLVAVIGLGALSGIVGAYSYSSPWRSVAHSLGLWIILSATVALGNTRKLAVYNALAALLPAVVSFYGSLALLYSYPVGLQSLVLWSVAALIAAGPIGVVASYAPRQDLPGSVTTALILGLLLGDAGVRLRNYGVDPAVLLDAAGAALLAALTFRTLSKVVTVLGLLPLAFVLGYTAVSVPNLVEQLYAERFGIY